MNTVNIQINSPGFSPINYNKDTLRTYLLEIGREPLLTPKQEVFYAQRVQKMRNLLNLKQDLVNKSQQQPTPEKWASEANITVPELQRILYRGKDAKEKMVRSNLKLVVSIAKKYQYHNLDLIDLIQEGSLGLQRAVEKYDPSKGFKFSTYAYWWIKQGITRAIEYQSRTIRLPSHVCQKLKKIKKVQTELTQKLGRAPTIADIAGYISVSTENLQKYLQIARKPVSLELRFGETQDTELQDLLEDPNSSLEKKTNENSVREILQAMISDLNPQQQEVISLHFGLQDSHELSLREVARRMDISYTRVRQIERQAFSHLRRKTKGMKEFFLHN
ncbi:sigma-70 family RNA polymerase sigma factor [Mastigocoleus sp. MO_188.B34]|uniref:sigma-70 family RNA polymerase sigma factor n=1 Tax=Mastigocoleus sp. MO_188.B34 TaxID=3036635 RepID=UPI00260EF5D3|nr:sigma-70 family RNA polymerase sigma factor [Mastigocoleus sp. MO_188.B34]MDJ0694190.1 sigma-70 family RNA polymerase sigma factor [Mastigocoleus sp. MO_188.B34]